MDYSKLTPYKLGETRNKEAIPYIIKFLDQGTYNEKMLATSAIYKLSTRYKNDCKSAIPYLCNNLFSENVQVRQFSLNTLSKLNIEADVLHLVKTIYENEQNDNNKQKILSIIADYMNAFKEIEGTSHSVVIDENISSSNQQYHDMQSDLSKGDTKLKDKLHTIHGLTGWFKRIMKKIMNYLNHKASIDNSNVMLNHKSQKETEFSEPECYKSTKINIINEDISHSAGTYTSNNHAVKQQVYYRENLLDDTFEELAIDVIMQNKDFMRFLEFYNKADFNYAGTIDEMSVLIEKYMNLIKDTRFDIIELKNEVEEYAMKYKIFQISDEEAQGYYNCKLEVEEYLIEEYCQLADEFANNFLDGLNNLNISNRDKEILRLKYNFYGVRRVTLQSIGNLYGLSRERIRQLVTRGNRKLRIVIKRKTNKDLLKLTLIMEKLLIPGSNTFYERYALFLVYGFQSANIEMLSQLITQAFYSDEQINNIVCYLSHHRFILKNKLEEDKRIQSQINLFNKRIGNKIIWPEKISLINESELSRIHPVREVDLDNGCISGQYFSKKMNKEIQYESQLELNILSILENCEKVKFYAVQAIKIPYRYKEDRIYIPDIFLVLDDGSGVIIECKPKTQMGLYLNLQKYFALKKYCAENGLGMLVTDGWASIEQITSYKYNELFERELLKRLEKGSLRWRELAALKDIYTVTNVDLMSIIINNNLYFEIDPYILSLKDPNTPWINPTTSTVPLN